MTLQGKAMQSAALATLSTTHLSPAPGPASLEAEDSLGAKQDVKKALPRGRKQAGLGFAVKGVETAKTRAAAGNRGKQQTPGGAGRAREAAQAPAAPAAKSKHIAKAAPRKACTQGLETGVEGRINNTLVQDVVAKRAIHRCKFRLHALQQVLDPYVRWKLVYLEKVRS